MSRHKRFTDGAGFTRHCWECVHATNWRKVISFDGNEADCELTGRHVEKHSSPNNQCSHVGIGCRYETMDKAVRVIGHDFKRAGDAE